MLHPFLRGRHVFVLVVFALLIATVAAFAPREVANAQAGGKNQMVSSDGQTLNAPSAGIALQDAFGGSGNTAGITAEDEGADAARLGPVSPKLGPGSIIGSDGRSKVTNTKVYPYRANAFLVVNFPGGGGTCTGWFIGPRTVMTAGHCVYDTDLNQWATSITVYPGRNGGTSPYGSASGCRFWSVNGWVSSESPEYDYGAIILPSNKALGNTVGWYGFFWTSSNSSLLNDYVRIYGYPGDKTYGTQWGMQNQIKQVATRQLFHNVDTYPGQSGSAVYETRSNGPYANSIHTYGLYGGSPYNRSTRITQGAYNNMVNWKNNPSC